MHLTDDQLRTGYIFQHLGANHQVKASIGQWDIFCSRYHIYERSAAQIQSNVPANAIRNQSPIRLDSSADIQYIESLRWELAQPMTEDFSPLSQDQPVGIGEPREKPLS